MEEPSLGTDAGVCDARLRWILGAPSGCFKGVIVSIYLEYSLIPRAEDTQFSLGVLEKDFL